jgi:hypothetical protein
MSRLLTLVAARDGQEPVFVERLPAIQDQIYCEQPCWFGSIVTSESDS